MRSGREDTEATASTASLGEKLPEYQSLKRERRKSQRSSFACASGFNYPSQTRPPTSREQLRDHAARFGDDGDRASGFIGQELMRIDAQQVVHRGEHILRANRV